ncbi:rod-binding protein [Wukongibacter baidiensis]|uniref:rod-binding protein n=1 Tax=Wukongibacter baidiensis TaxID=1723361 RepID=UPI003D7F95D6
MRINNNLLEYNLNNAKQVSNEQKTDDFKDILESAKASNDDERLEATCKQFESIFLSMLMKNMRKTVVDGGLIEKSHAREMFEGMLDEEIAKESSKEHGIGLAKLMYEQLSKGMDSKG